MRGWGTDVRQIGRGLIRRPGYSLVAVGTLALGIGLGTAIFSMAEALVLRPLPLPEADRLVQVVTQNPTRETGWSSVSYPNFESLEATSGFTERSFYRIVDRGVSGAADPERLRVALVHERYFETLGSSALRGRLLADADHAVQAAPSIVLSEALWVRRYGADPSILGRTVRLDGEAHTVVGVLSAEGAWPPHAEAWVPLRWGGTVPEWAGARSNHAWQVVGRIAPDLPITVLSDRVAEVSRAVYAGEDSEDRESGTELLAVHLRTAEGAGELFGTLGAAVFLIALLTCMNASGLFLSRGWARERELSVRAALGAGRARIAAVLLGEALVLALIAGLVGAALGVWAMDRGFRSTPPEIRSLAEIHLNPMVLGGALLISIVAAVMAGVVPAWTGSRVALASSMKDGGGGGRSRRATKTRRVLVVAEVAVSLALLVSAGLAVEGFQQQLASDPGFDTDDLMTFAVRLPAVRYPDEAATEQFFDEAVTALEADPALRSASVTSALPMGAGGLSLSRAYAWEDALPPDGPEFAANWIGVDAEWFATLGVPPIDGRVFTPTDDATSEPVAILSRRMAVRMSGEGDVLGRRLRSIHDEAVARTVVGVVDDLQINGVARPVPASFVLVPRAQAARRNMEFLVRTRADAAVAVPAIRAVMKRLDSDVAVHDLRTLRQAHAADLGGIRFLSRLFAAFGAVALLLAVTGVYGLVSMSVSRRVREIGVRMAVGATAGRVRSAVLRESVLLGVLGLVAGSGLAWVGTKALAAGFAGIATPTVGTVALIAGLLLAGVVGGAWIPARRATRITPVDALRVD